MLTTQPTDSVTIEVMADTQTSVSPTSLTFSPDNWDSAQTVSVTAVDDLIAEGKHIGTINHTATSSDLDYNELPVDAVTATIIDNDSAGVSLSPTSVSVTEGGATASYQVVLTTQPTDSVTIEVMADTQTSVSPTSLTFSPDNWDSAQTVSVTAVDDLIAEGKHMGTINHTATSSDLDYNELPVDAVTATIIDNDSPGVSLSPTSVTVTEGGATASYQVVLTTQPTDSVTIEVMADTQTSVSPTSLTFSPDNWDSAQTVSVTAVDDLIAEGEHLGSINHTATSSDLGYNGLPVDAVTATITDNDDVEVEFELEQSQVTMETNEQISQSLSLSNTSNITLNWQAFTEEGLLRQSVLGEESSDNNNETEWLMLNPKSGAILPGESQGMEVNIDAAGLDPGDYQANICIWFSEPDMMISIPVSLTVAEPTAVEMGALTASKQSNTLPLGLLAASIVFLLAGGYVALRKRDYC